MSTHPRWISALLALSVLTACATTASPGARSETAASATAPPAQRVSITGSRIAQPVDPRAAPSQPASPMQSVSQDELSNSGRDNLAEALRSLVPTLH
jgi:curli biogenesis system outer membrane secretion channel CsgG